MNQNTMLDTKSIFGVDGIVAVVTGGGTGQIVHSRFAPNGIQF